MTAREKKPRWLSVPDAILEIGRARDEGATHDQIQICIALGRMVRKNSFFRSRDREASRPHIGFRESISVKIKI